MNANNDTRTPSQILRTLDLSAPTAALEARKAELNELPWSSLTDAEHLEVAAIASELERRRFAAR